MQREIKFRALDTIQLKYHYNVECGIDLGVWMSFGDVLRDNRFVVEQFTGLYDKNGKEIYEGDIVLHEIWHGGVENLMYETYLAKEGKTTNWKYPYLIVWEKGEFIIKQNFSDTYPESLPLRMVAGQQGPDNVEIIGNIHENPELLK